MNVDDYLGIFGESSTEAAGESGEPIAVTLSARLIGHDDDVLEIEIFSVRYRLDRLEVLDIAPSTRAVAVTPTNEGDAVTLVVRGDAVLARTGTVRAASLIDSMPMVLRRPTAMPDRDGPPREHRQWFEERGLASAVASPRSWTNTQCPQQQPTFCQQVDPTYSQDSQGNRTQDDTTSSSVMDDSTSVMITDDTSYDDD